MRRRTEDEERSAIEPADVDAALDLLDSEREVGRALTRSSAHEFVEDLLIGVVFFALPVGLTVVWSNPWLGGLLLAVALACVVIVGVVPASEVAEETTRIRSTLDALEPVHVAIGTWARSGHWAPSALMLAGLAAWIAGMVWLIWAQVADGDVPILAVALVALGSLAFWAGYAVDEIGDFRYYTRVERAIDRIREQAETAESGPVVVSGDVISVLSQAETHQLRRTVEESVKQLPDVLDDYAVALAPEAQHSLEQLAEASPEDWLQITETIHALQIDPRPESARPLAGIPGAVEVVAAEHGVGYHVDDELHRIYVVAVDAESKREADDV